MCDPRCLSWYSDNPAAAHDCRDSHGHTPARMPDDPVAEQRRDTHLQPPADADDCPHSLNGVSR